MVELATKQLLIELRRQVHSSVKFQPHTDYDPTTGDGLNICDFASLPGIGLTALRLPPSADIGDSEAPGVDLGGGLVAVRRQPVVRDALMTCIVASDSSRELMWLDTVLGIFARKNASLEATNADGTPLLDISGQPVIWTLDYQRGEPVTYNDRQNGVEWFTADFRDPESPGDGHAWSPDSGYLR